mmetsp:Transcript_33456/g.78303  ORF Transcript_33456/g.78303 Transcript_33456/m.78303 type:complete len:229 (-) Transcript_33456:482-1168(-)
MSSTSFSALFGAATTAARPAGIATGSTTLFGAAAADQPAGLAAGGAAGLSLSGFIERIVGACSLSFFCLRERSEPPRATYAITLANRPRSGACSAASTMFSLRRTMPRSSSARTKLVGVSLTEFSARSYMKMSLPVTRGRLGREGGPLRDRSTPRAISLFVAALSLIGSGALDPTIEPIFLRLSAAGLLRPSIWLSRRAARCASRSSRFASAASSALVSSARCFRSSA